MAIDRGGLEYTIRVKNEFSIPLKRFRTQLDSSRTAFRRFRGSLRGLGAETRQLRTNLAAIADASQRLGVAQRRALGPTRTLAQALGVQRRNLNSIVHAQNRQINQVSRLAAAQRRTIQSVDNLTRALASQSRALQDIVRLQRQQARVSRAARASTRNLRSFNKELSRTGSRANRIFFSLQRVIGIFLAFAAIRVAVDGFRALVSGAIRFNSTIEKAQLGIASLLTAVTDVSDATGAAAGSAQGLALAQAEARRQTELLRRDALKTAATFDQLLETFQIAVAPGFTAGLDIEEIRQFTVLISQSAAALGVAQNQLSEEIRSILSGTIQQRTTRIAVALGITNEDIRAAREAGELADFLFDRFSAFREAGEEALGTFTVILTNTKDAILQLLGSGGLEFFEQTKLLLRDIFDTITEQDPQGILSPDPRALAVVESLFAGITAAVEEARRLGRALDFEDVKATLELIGGSIGLVAKVLGGFIEDTVNLVGTAIRVTKVLVGLMKRFAAEAGLSEAALRPIESVILAIGFSLIEVTQTLRTAFRTAIADILTDFTSFGKSIADSLDESGLEALSGPFRALEAVSRHFNEELRAQARAQAILDEQRNEGLREAIRLTAALAQNATSPGAVAGAFKGIASALAVAFPAIEKLLVGVEETAEEGKTLSEIFLELPGIFRKGREGLQDQSGILGTIVSQARQARQELTLVQRTLGVEGTVLAQQGVAARERLRIDSALRKLTKERVEEETRLAGLQARQQRVQEEIANSSGTVASGTKAAGIAARGLLDITRQIAQAETQVSLTRVRLNRALSAGNQEDIANLRQRLAAQQEIVTAKKAELTAQKAITDALLADLSSGDRQEVVRLSSEHLLLTGELEIQQKRLNGIAAEGARIERETNAIIAARVQALAEAETFRLQQEQPVLAAQAGAALRLESVPDLEPDERRAALAQNVLEITRAQNAAVARGRQLEVESLQTLIAATKNDETRLSLRNQLAAVQQRNVFQQQIEGVAARKATEELQRARDIAEAPVTLGITTALEDFALRAGDIFQGTLNLMTGLLNNFTAFIADSLIAAFDPSEDQTFQQRFDKFLQRLLRQILTFLIQVAVAKAIVAAIDIMSFGAGTAVKTGVSLGTGFAKGVGGFAEGGQIPGPAGASIPGLDPRDSVLIAAQPREFMQPVKAVDTYGLRVMEAIRRGQIDPVALKSLAGVSGFVRTPKSPMGRMGYQTGGQITSQGSPSTASGPVAAFVVPDEQALERMLAGGTSAMLQFMRDNRGSIRNALGT